LGAGAVAAGGVAGFPGTGGTAGTTGSDGNRVETLPKTDRFSLNGNVNLGRSLSLLVTVERPNGGLSTDSRGTLCFAVRS
jgi:hypothetical protein